MNKGIVTFLDILGWKGIYNRQKNAIELLRSLIETCQIKQLEVNRGREKSIYMEMTSISDTIVIHTICEESEKDDVMDMDKKIRDAIEMHGTLCQWIIPTSIDYELPIRGATAYGEFEKFQNIFVGKAVDEAASWHEQSNWIGVNLTPSANFIFKQNPKNSSWVKYELPSKIAVKWQPYCVDWTTGWKDYDEKIDELKRKFINMGPLLPEIAPKYINTLTFLEVQKKVNSKRKRNREIISN